MSKFFISDLFKNIILKFLPSINLIQGSLDKKKQFEQKINYLGRFVVNAVLLRVRPRMYQSRYSPSAVNIKQNIIHTATIQWTIQRHYTGRDLVWYVNQTIAIYWWMSQTEHDPHGYNPVNYTTPLHWARSRLLYQPDNIYWSMSQTGHDPHRYNPMNYQHHHHWARSRFQCQPGNIYWSISMLKARSQFVCFNKTIILYTII